MRWGSVCGRGSRRKGTKLGSTHCWQETAPISRMLRCSGLLGQVMGLGTGCEFWDIGVSCVSCTRVSWLSALADRLRRDSIPCLPRRACSRHPHQTPRPHSTHQSINQSIAQSATLGPSLRQSVGRSRRIESYRVRGAARLHHAARRSLKSPPDGLAHLWLPATAASPCCCPCAVLRCAAPSVVFAWASGDGPELDEHAPCGISLGVSEAEEDYSPVLYLMNWLSGGEMTGNCCMRQEDKV